MSEFGVYLNKVLLHLFVPDTCNSVLTSERAKIRAATEPMSDCYYYITLQEEFHVYLTFHKFNVRSAIANHTCLHNYIEVYAGKGNVRIHHSVVFNIPTFILICPCNIPLP